MADRLSNFVEEDRLTLQVRHQGRRRQLKGQGGILVELAVSNTKQPEGAGRARRPSYPWQNASAPEYL